jgi:hypothetical protein
VRLCPPGDLGQLVELLAGQQLEETLTHCVDMTGNRRMLFRSETVGSSRSKVQGAEA